ncbi:hypothetical protein DLM85_15995 [Hymenobacter edaphi]|uniref:Uncharacterized protein n=1 Tax=Hymenobacter edaphi TaxID=2211146 RepID=A0A328BHV7_9BACT|nr:hypothetical protein DLM85_15995 [Hymenobacter edaphi]
MYLTGHFQGHLTLGQLHLQSAGLADIFLAAWSPAKNRFLWAKRVGGPGHDYPSALAVQGSSLVMVGSFEGPALQLGSLQLANTDSAGGTYDSFVTKLTTTGEGARFAWVLPWTGLGDNNLVALAVQGAAVFVAGNAYAEVRLGTQKESYARAFVAKLTDEGAQAAVQWIQPVGGSVQALAVAGSAVYIAGHLDHPDLTFGQSLTPHEQAGYDGNQTGDNNSFVAKIEDRGEQSFLAWARRIGGPGVNVTRVRALAVQQQQLYVTGVFFGRATFGPFRLTSSAYGHSGDVFVVKLTDYLEPVFRWAQQLGGVDEEEVNTLLVHGKDVYMAGTFLSDSVTIESQTIRRTQGSGRKHELYIARLQDADSTSQFTMLTAGVAGGPATPQALAWQPHRLYVGGQTSFPVSFGKQALPEPKPGSGAFWATLRLESKPPKATRKASRRKPASRQ